VTGGRIFKIGCGVALSAIVLGGLAAIGVFGIAAVSWWHKLGQSLPAASASGDPNSVQPPTLYLKVTQPAVAPYAGPARNLGFDVSYPQCGVSLPSTGGGFAIIGIANGRPITANPCRAAQWSWAQQQSAAAVYVNTSDPADRDPAVWGQVAATSALFGIHATGVPQGTTVWLDVETDNQWVGSWNRHVTVLQTMAQAIADAGYRVGIYSSANLWYAITGNAIVNVPIWYATGPGTSRTALANCPNYGFGGQKPSIVQWVQTTQGHSLDHNKLCPGVGATGVLRPTGSG
jgi:Domain of unknown function (DUF1906)